MPSHKKSETKSTVLKSNSNCNSEVWSHQNLDSVLSPSRMTQISTYDTLHSSAEGPWKHPLNVIHPQKLILLIPCTYRPTLRLHLFCRIMHFCHTQVHNVIFYLLNLPAVMTWTIVNNWELSSSKGWYQLCRQVCWCCMLLNLFAWKGGFPRVLVQCFEEVQHGLAN